MCVCECARVSVRARGAASAVRAPPGAGRRGSPGSGASRTELAGHRGRPRRPAGRCGGQSAGPVGAGGGTHCKCLNLRGRPTGPRWGGGATGAGRGARFPGRLPERRVLCPRGVPGREQVGSRGDRGGLFSSRGRGGGGAFVIFYPVRSLLPLPRLLGLAAAQWTETCFSLGRPFLERAEDGRASDLPRGWRRPLLPAPRPCSWRCWLRLSAVRTQRRRERNPPVEITF